MKGGICDVHQVIDQLNEYKFRLSEMMSMFTVFRIL
jgi:hypothetical protein